MFYQKDIHYPAFGMFEHLCGCPVLLLVYINKYMLFVVSPCSTVVCNDGECYYNESGIAKCFNQAEQYCQGKLMLEQKLITQIAI